MSETIKTTEKVQVNQKSLASGTVRQGRRPMFRAHAQTDNVEAATRADRPAFNTAATRIHGELT